jgi:CHASE3 domain sensor protein
VLVGVILVAVLLSVTNLRDSDRTVRQSADLLTRSLTDERSVVELDTELRGFLLTRQAGFLHSYAKDQSALAGQLDSLRGLANDPTEQRRIRDIASGIGSYVSGYAKPLAAAGSRLSDSAKRGAAARGEQLLNTVHNSFRLLDTRILRLSESQRESASSAASQAIGVAAVGLVVAILFLLAAGFYLLRRVLRPIRRVARAGMARWPGSDTRSTRWRSRCSATRTSRSGCSTSWRRRPRRPRRPRR